MSVTKQTVWDKEGERWLENGTRHGTLFTPGATPAANPSTSEEWSNKFYGTASAWNGITAVTETPGGAEANDVYADDIKYATLRSAETFGGTIEAFTYPNEWAKCDGSYSDTNALGVNFGQQTREKFGFSFESQVFNDTNTDADDDEKLHLWYGCSASPSDRSYATINDSPEGISFSWEISSIPISIEDKVALSDVPKKSISTITIQKNTTFEATAAVSDLSLAVGSYARYEVLKLILAGYKLDTTGATAVAGRLPYPDEVYNLFRYGFTVSGGKITIRTAESTGTSDDVAPTTP